MNDYLISSDNSKLDLNTIHSFITNSYWANGRSIEEVELSIQNSDCYGVYSGDIQIGFARVLTDCVSIAFLMDVFILEEHRGKGLGKKLIAAVLEIPKYRAVKKWRLATKDAHKLYEKFGFYQITGVENQMERKNNS